VHSNMESKYPGMNKVVELIKSGSCKNIVFLTGAGISVGAGIPDFRSTGGMYDTLQPDLLTATEEQRSMMRADPTSVVCKQLFNENQLCYLELRRPFILGVAEKKNGKQQLDIFLLNYVMTREY